MDMKCFITDCQKVASGNVWQGKPCCSTHYHELFASDFEREYACWESHMQPSPNLRRLFGRLLEEYRWKWQVIGAPLSQAKVRDRAFNFIKEDTGFTFEITRHPGAFKDMFSTERIVQKWRVTFQDCVFELIEERPWTENDFDL